MIDGESVAVPILEKRECRGCFSLPAGTVVLPSCVEPVTDVQQCVAQVSVHVAVIAAVAGYAYVVGLALSQQVDGLEFYAECLVLEKGLG